jgi:hypothetical protein
MNPTNRLIAVITAGLFAAGCGGEGDCRCLSTTGSGEFFRPQPASGNCQDLAQELPNVSHCSKNNTESITGPGGGLSFLRSQGNAKDVDLRTTDYLLARPRATGVWDGPSHPR